jgi:hypothetical protein
MNRTTSRHRQLLQRHFGRALTVAALTISAAACGGDDDTQRTTDARPASTSPATTGGTAATPDADALAFCDAAVAAEAATMSEDPAVIEAAFVAAAETAPADIKPVVDTVIAEASAGNQGSPEFTTAYDVLTDWAISECGFADVEVSASEYAFTGLPDTLEAGPLVLGLDNTGSELHQLMLLRLRDDVTADLAELSGRDEGGIFAVSTPVGGAFAAPGEHGAGMVDLPPGRYLALCLLPTGATPENMPMIESGDHDGMAHYTVGMIDDITVI